MSVRLSRTHSEGFDFQNAAFNGVSHLILNGTAYTRFCKEPRWMFGVVLFYLVRMRLRADDYSELSKSLHQTTSFATSENNITDTMHRRGERKIQKENNSAGMLSHCKR